MRNKIWNRRPMIQTLCHVFRNSHFSKKKFKTCTFYKLNNCFDHSKCATYYSTEYHNVRFVVHRNLKSWKLVYDIQSSYYHQGSDVMWNTIPKLLSQITKQKTFSTKFMQKLSFNNNFMTSKILL
jgi:hypothetical protein